MNRLDQFTFHVAGRIRDQLLAGQTRAIAEHDEQAARVPGPLEHDLWLHRRIAKYRTRGFTAAAHRLREEANSVLRRLVAELECMRRSASWRPAPAPSLRDIVAELDRLVDEFGEWHYDPAEQAVSVVTDAIELDGVYLGPFEIKLLLGDLIETRGSTPYRVNALDPHPAATNEEVTHPHVSGGSLCAGDASAALTAALASGRLCEFFLLVRSVLTTYNLARHMCRSRTGTAWRVPTAAAPRAATAGTGASDASTTFVTSAPTAADAAIRFYAAAASRSALHVPGRSARRVIPSKRPGSLLDDRYLLGYVPHRQGLPQPVRMWRPGSIFAGRWISRLAPSVGLRICTTL